jgi:hypothetical protein
VDPCCEKALDASKLKMMMTIGVRSLPIAALARSPYLSTTPLLAMPYPQSRID